ncbi:MAG: glycosyltransferase [Kiritimatiellae bacterium]|nr:glycosyltransferase [Kiritimatiellia bacterium]MDW8458671.1 glycosyltransferase [Verrucomicrobiota bacterium]
MNPVVSVVIATRNCAGTVGAALESVLRFGGNRVELLVRDGGSTDDTLKVLRQYETHIAWWESSPDKGVYDAMNQAVKQARAPHIYFLGADDQLLEGFSAALDRLVEPGTLYYGDVLLASTGKRYAGAFDGRKLARTNICQQAIFYPREVFTRRQFDLRYPRLADWAFNMACWSDPAVRFEYLNLEIALYEDRSGLSARHMDWAFYDDYGSLLRQHFRPPERRLALMRYRLSRLYRLATGRSGVRPAPLRGA